MSNQTGFDYEVMLSRLHGGVCAFRSLRAHRRQREQAGQPMTEERGTPEPPRAPRVAHVDELAELRATASLEPQAFVAVGDRMVPLFGNVNAGLFGAMTTPAGPVASPTIPSATSTATPAPIAEEPPPPAPAPAASTLRLPPPTPPPRLSMIYGGRPPPAEPVSEPSTATPRPPIGDPPAARSQSAASSPTAAQVHDAPKLAPIAALLDARAQEDAQRLEKAHAEHRAAMAMLMRAHRDELRAQSEADAVRTTQLLRDVFAEHRAELRAQSEADAARTTQLLREVFAGHHAELSRASQAHADHLAQILAQHPPTDQRTATGDTGELRAALLEQASLQREANEDAADHITALTTIVADLGQTVGMLAVAAAHKTQHSYLSTRPTFAPPPRVESGTPVVPATPPRIESGTPVTSATPPHFEPATPAAASAPVEAAAPVSSDAPTTAANQHLRTAPSSLSHRITEEPAHQRPIRLTLPQEAAERARLQSALEDDEDDGDLEAGLASDDTDDDLMPRRRLPPITEIESPDDQEPDDV